MRRWRWWWLVAAVVVMALPGRAQADTGIAGLKVRVLLPPGYETQPHRRWPTLYVVPGSGCDGDIATRDLELDSWPGRQDALVVIVWETGNDGWNYITDYLDGSSPLDTEFSTQLVPWVDSHYRTRSARRAIVGYSSGGYSAAEIATVHPGLFSAVGTFSGVVDITDRDPAGEWLVLAPNLLTDQVDGQNDALRRWGDPVADAANWHAKNPADHPLALKQTSVLYIAAGDGVPAGDAPAVGDDPSRVVSLAPQVEAEEEVGSMTAAYDRALTAAGVSHVYRPHHGIHSAVDWRIDLATFWPLVRSAWHLGDA